jgi:ubiquinone/menaquinone biosynthesis C-methylase UbiE
MTHREPETDYAAYIQSLEETLKETRTHDEIMQMAVGDAFDAIGTLERELLIQHGRDKDSYLIDVGCGSGRLAIPLSTYLRGRYMGIDIVPTLVQHARERAGRPDWRFEVTDGYSIPEEAEQADMVCFFSVFTHLRHEVTYGYLQEAERVLKPGGRIVFSFLEFPNPHNWAISTMMSRSWVRTSL